MIESLRKKISDTIYEKQNRKEELYDKISRVENELLELNDTLVKLNEEDAFFKMSPYEAFNILDKLGYTNEKEKYDIYFNLVSKQDVKKETDNIALKENSNTDNIKENVNTYNSYEEKIEECKEDLTKEQRKKLGKLVEILVEEFYDDDFYYYISSVKISKFRVYYNLSILLSDTYKKEELYDMVKIAFTYKTITNDNKEKVLKGLEKIEDKIKMLQI